MNKPLIFAHRALDWWEGDLRQIANADYVEMDVRKTTDDVLVVCHQRSVKNTVRRVLVDRSSYARIYKKTGKKLPKLDDVLEELKGKTRFNLDLRQPGMTSDIKDVIKRHRIQEQVLVDSRRCDELEDLSRTFSQARYAYEYNLRDFKGLGSYRVFRGIAYFSYFAFYPFWPRVVKLVTNRVAYVPGASIFYKLVNEGVVEFFKNRRIPVYVWSVNKEADMRKMIEVGVDGIKTMKPELLRGILEK